MFWLIENISDGDFVFRRQCMKCIVDLSIVYDLTSTASREQNPSYFAHSYISNRFKVTTGPLTDMISVVERNFMGITTDSDSGMQQSHSGNNEWCKSLIGVLDAYNWLISCVGFSPSQIFINPSVNAEVENNRKAKRTKSTAVKRGNDLSTILYYVQSFIIDIYSGYDRKLKASVPNSVLVSDQTTESNKCQPELCRRIIQLFSSIIQKDANEFMSDAGTTTESFSAWQELNVIMLALMFPMDGASDIIHPSLFPLKAYMDEEVKVNLPSAIKLFVSDVHNMSHNRNNASTINTGIILNPLLWTECCLKSLRSIVALSNPAHISRIRDSIQFATKFCLFSSDSRVQCQSEVNRIMQFCTVRTSATSDTKNNKAVSELLQLITDIGFPLYVPDRSVYSQDSIIALVFSLPSDALLQFIGSYGDSLVQMILENDSMLCQPTTIAFINFLMNHSQTDTIGISKCYTLSKLLLAIINVSIANDNTNSNICNVFENCLVQSYDFVNNCVTIDYKILELIFQLLMSSESSRLCLLSNTSRASLVYYAILQHLTDKLNNSSSCCEDIIIILRLIPYYVTGLSTSSVLPTGVPIMKSNESKVMYL